MKRLESLVQSTARHHNSVVNARCLCDVTFGDKLSRRSGRDFKLSICAAVREE